jgi:hypothetical protein
MLAVSNVAETFGGGYNTTRYVGSTRGICLKLSEAS